jgi:beta-glucosidase
VPFVLALVHTKPLVLPKSAERAQAIVACFNPGMLGGTAFAELMFGDLNPSAKLSMTFPRHVGQCPVYYAELSHRHGGYADLPMTPAFSFGFGLSYTRYEYANLTVETPSLDVGECLRASVDVSNRGDRDGVEIVQAYVRDVVTSVTWPSHLLVGFERVSLAAGETRRVHFEIPFERLALIDAFERRTVEPGEFEIQLGASSERAALLLGRFQVRGAVDPLSRIPGVLDLQKA